MPEISEVIQLPGGKFEIEYSDGSTATRSVEDIPSSSSVPGDGIAVATSRNALTSDSGATLELSSGVTYTLTDAVTLPAGVTLMGPASGSATIAVTGSATINGGSSSITVNAGQVYAAIPRPSAPAAFVVKGS